MQENKQRSKKRRKLKKGPFIVLVALALIAGGCIIYGAVKVIDNIGKDEVLSNSISVTINPNASIKNEASDYNIYVDENKLIKDDTTKLLSDYGLTYNDKIDEQSTIQLDLEGEETNFVLNENGMVINTFTLEECLLQYNLIIDPSLKITGVMITPYIKNSEEKYIPLYELSLDTGSYDKQTEIYLALEPQIDNITYIPLTPYAHIAEVKELTPATVVNKNMCLSEDYAQPAIDVPNVTNGLPTTEYIQVSIIDQTEAFIKDLSNQGLDVRINSGYRSYETQQDLYDMYVATDGVEEADKYSARPGCSEHQTGLAFDVATTEMGSEMESLNNTPEAQLIYDTAPQYGFIVRYPSNKEHITQYNYESWHVRYVGEEVANIIYNENITLDQYAHSSEYYDAKYANKEANDNTQETEEATAKDESTNETEATNEN